MAHKIDITRSDILSPITYEGIRREKRSEIVKIKQNRRLAVGPHVTFYFECYETIWYQIHEMLRIEKGGEEQIPEEIQAYNSLIPKGTGLVATVMFEIPNAEHRARILAGLGGVENTIIMEIGNETIRAAAEEDLDRTSATGKASSVHFMHFTLSSEQIYAFKNNNSQVTIRIEHVNYDHMAIMPKNIREELSKDFS